MIADGCVDFPFLKSIDFDIFKSRTDLSWRDSVFLKIAIATVRCAAARFPVWFFRKRSFDRRVRLGWGNYFAYFGLANEAQSNGA